MSATSFIFSSSSELIMRSFIVILPISFLSRLRKWGWASVKGTMTSKRRRNEGGRIVRGWCFFFFFFSFFGMGRGFFPKKRRKKWLDSTQPNSTRFCNTSRKNYKLLTLLVSVFKYSMYINQKKAIVVLSFKTDSTRLDSIWSDVWFPIALPVAKCDKSHRVLVGALVLSSDSKRAKAKHFLLFPQAK